MESIAKVVIRPITWAFPTFISVPTVTVARAAINKTVTPTDTPFEIIENKAIHVLGACESGGDAGNQ
jgi:hypothetical protein